MWIIYVLIALMVFIGYLGFIRNSMVNSYRAMLISWAFHDTNWRLRSRVLDRVSYDAMVLQFWRPLKTFAPEEHALMMDWMQEKTPQ